MIKIVAMMLSSHTRILATAVSEKFTIGYFHVKIIHGKIFSSLGGI